MLQLIRGTVGSWIVKGLFVLLIVSFGIWGIGDIFRNHSQSNTVAEVGPIKITAGQLEIEFRQQLNRMRNLMGAQFDTEQARALGLVDQSLQQIIQRQLIDLAAADAGLRITDPLVQQRIREQPGFRNPLGQFDPEMFRRALAANSLTEPLYVESLRGEISRQLVVGAVAAGAEAPKLLVEDLIRYREEKRIAETLTLKSADITDIGAPDEAQLQQYHEDHTIQFTSPEYRSLTVAMLSVAALAQQVEVSDEEIKNGFEARADEFVIPEKRTVLQVVVDSRDKAEAIAKAAREGKDLTAAAKAAGVDTVTLESETQAELAELGTAVFGLTPGQFSDPVESPLGWHVAAVTKIEPAAEKSLAEVRDQVAAALRTEKATDRLYEISNQFEDAIAGGASLEEAAAKLSGTTLTRIEQVDATGARADGSKADAAVALATVLQAAFNLAQGNRSPLAETNDGRYFTVRVDQITPARLKPLTEVRADVVAGWQAEQRTKRAAAKAEEMVKQLRDGKSPAEVAAAFGAVLSTTEPFTRATRQGGPVPAILVNALFEAAIGGVASAATAPPAPDGQIVARLKEIVPADPSKAAAALERARQSARQSIAGDLVAQFIEAQRKQYPVSLDQARLQSLYPPAN